ncbi:hypothetical protein Mal64_39080 [Pseudobythopirellula maris]|uniref:DNA alkylation repair enzyme n=1 Tax=Pseudobythopirellula maris TaxID=2527991 RepID=A0A5C5ZG98_9BACT|nr:hypothetical protein [Pseudobythopirellula maris]TWT86168.1 hypothetical protein Mal64_39080 [Pseudobythopirellula maris]
MLHADPTRYVTRSVANHLNDIAKSQPGVVIDTLERWKEQAAQDAAELRWMSKQALRTLVKKGDPRALRFLGFRPDPRVEVTGFTIVSPKIKRGEAVEFTFSVAASRDGALMIDFVIDFVKANGALSPKVHKLKQIALRKGESATLHKRHVLRAGATTYKLYPGTHRVTLQINGKPFGTESFVLR